MCEQCAQQYLFTAIQALKVAQWDEASDRVHAIVCNPLAASSFTHRKSAKNRIKEAGMNDPFSRFGRDLRTNGRLNFFPPRHISASFHSSSNDDI